MAISKRTSALLWNISIFIAIKLMIYLFPTHFGTIGPIVANSYFALSVLVFVFTPKYRCISAEELIRIVGKGFPVFVLLSLLMLLAAGFTDTLLNFIDHPDKEPSKESLAAMAAALATAFSGVLIILFYIVGKFGEEIEKRNRKDNIAQTLFQETTRNCHKLEEFFWERKESFDKHINAKTDEAQLTDLQPYFKPVTRFLDINAKHFTSFPKDTNFSLVAYTHQIEEFDRIIYQARELRPNNPPLIHMHHIFRLFEATVAAQNHIAKEINEEMFSFHDDLRIFEQK